MIEFKNFANPEEIFELEKICFQVSWTLEQIQSHLNHFSVLIAEEENELIAYVLYIKSFDEIEIFRIAVIPKKRKSNIGTKLIHNLIQIDTVKKIFLEVNEENFIAIHFYEKNSFQKIGIRKKYYPNNKDAIQYLKEV